MLNTLNKLEDDLIKDFKSHPIFANINNLSNEQLHYILLENWSLSTYFIPFLSSAEIGIINKATQISISSVIISEINDNSLRTLYIEDLKKIGLERTTILQHEGSEFTKSISNQRHALVHFDSSIKQKYFDIRVAVTVRFCGLILAGAFYEIFIAELARRKVLTLQSTDFFTETIRLYQKTVTLGKPGLGPAASLTDEFSCPIGTMINDQNAQNIAIEYYNKSFQIRYAFFDQFL